MFFYLIGALILIIFGFLVCWIRQLTKYNATKSKVLKLALKGSKVGIWDWSLKTDKVKRNADFGELLGYSGELGDKPLFAENLMHPEDIYQVKAALIDLIQGRTKEYEAEYRLKAGDGSWNWVLDRGIAVEFTRKGQATRIAGVTIDIAKQKETEKQLERLGYTDPLTGLRNRAFFEKELKRLDKEEFLPLSVVLGDLNGLKLANDTFGHKEGDRLLVSVAELLKHNFRKDDVITRWGGDEFAVLLPCTPKETALEICSRIQQICAATDSDTIQPSIALGVATREKLADPILEVLELAETRMYERKTWANKANCHALSTALLETLMTKCDENCIHYRKIKALIGEIDKALDIASTSSEF